MNNNHNLGKVEYQGFLVDDMSKEYINWGAQDAFVNIQ